MGEEETYVKIYAVTGNAAIEVAAVKENVIELLVDVVVPDRTGAPGTVATRVAFGIIRAEEEPTELFATRDIL